MRYKSLTQATVIALFAVHATSSTSNAQSPTPFTPKDRANIVVRKIPGRATDLLGIRTGMSLAEVQSILLKETPSRRLDTQFKTLGARINGVSVKMEPFVQRLRDEGDAQAEVNETIDASFSSQASGNKLISFDRFIMYRNGLSSPRFEDIKRSVVSKFGEPTSIRDNTVAYEMIYAFRNGRPVKCASSVKGAETCTTFARDAYQPENLKYHMEELAAGDDFVLIVSAWRMSNSDRVSSVEYLMSDYTARAMASKADSESMIENATQAQASVPTPSAPKL